MITIPRKRFLLLLFVLILLIYFVLLPITAYLYGNHQLKAVASQIERNSSSQEELINNTAAWEIAHLKSTYGKKYNWQDELERRVYITYFRTPFFPFNEPWWIMTFKRGACGEFASFFEGFMKEYGIPVRKIICDSEDHSWNEVYLNGSWVHIDPWHFAHVGLEYFNNPEVYENKWGYNISYVYFIDEEGEKVDITSKYTKLGTLRVLVMNKHQPVSNANVKVYSRYKMENEYNLYTKPRLVLENRTNQDGIAEFVIGGNNYTIIAEKQFGLLRDQKTITLNENESITVEMRPWELAPWCLSLLLVVVWGALAYLCYCIYKNRDRLRIN